MQAAPLEPFHEFPDDAACWDVDDQFLLGPSILVAPVMTEGATSRSVHLPDGADRTRTSDGRTLAGGQRIEDEAPLATVPVHFRDGEHAHLVGSLAPRP